MINLTQITSPFNLNFQALDYKAGLRCDSLSKVAHRLFSYLSSKTSSIIQISCVSILAGSIFYLMYKVHLIYKAACLKAFEEKARETFEPLRIKILNSTLLTDDDRQSPAFIMLQKLLVMDSDRLTNFYQEQNLYFSSIIIPFLYTLFGIKPAFTTIFCYDTTDKTRNASSLVQMLRKISQLNPHCHFQETQTPNIKGFTNYSIYIVNHSPIPLFDPSRYLKTYNSQQEGLTLLKQADCSASVDVQKKLSYVLGYGSSYPAWASLHPVNSNILDGEDCFSDEHYRQLGLAVLTNPSDEDAIKAGRDYTQKMYSKKGEIKNKEEREKLEKKLSRFLLLFRFDEIVAKTLYFKVTVYYMNNVLKALLPPQRDSHDLKEHITWVKEITNGLETSLQPLNHGHL